MFKEGLPKGEAIRGINFYQNKNIILTSSEEIEKKVIQENPRLDFADAKKVFPDKIRIEVQVAEPIAILQASNGFFYLSKQGRIVFKRRAVEQPLPMVHYYQKFDYFARNAGETISFRDVIFGLYFLDAAQGLNLKVDSIDIDGMHMIVLHIGEKSIFFTTQKDRAQQEYELGKIIHQFKIQGKEFKTIDLRFDRPVIVLNT